VQAAAPFVSFARNAEDVVLHRALRDVTAGRYVEIGPTHPTDASATRAFYDRGWRGLVIQPSAAYVEEFCRVRPEDTVVQAPLDAANESASGRGLDAVLAERLSNDHDVHFLVVEVAGLQRDMLAGLDLRRWRPWVLVLAGGDPEPAPPTHEACEALLLEAGYELCLFDGVSRFYVAAEHADRLRPLLSFPADAVDDHVPRPCDELVRELAAAREELATLRAAHEEALDQLVRWRGAVLARWSDAVGTAPRSLAGAAGRGSHEAARLKEELAAMQATVSWRITAPLRALQRQRREWR